MLIRTRAVSERERALVPPRTSRAIIEAARTSSTGCATARSRTPDSRALRNATDDTLVTKRIASELKANLWPNPKDRENTAVSKSKWNTGARLTNASFARSAA